jgi:ABC-type uncharacterized transport system ATPase subunit
MGSGGFAGAPPSGDARTRDNPDDRAVQRALAARTASGRALARFEHVKPTQHEIFVDKVGHAEVADRRPEVARA